MISPINQRLLMCVVFRMVNSESLLAHMGSTFLFAARFANKKFTRRKS